MNCIPIAEYYRKAKERREKRRDKGIALGLRKRKKVKRSQTIRGALLDKLYSLVKFFVRMRDKRENDGLCVICCRNPQECCYHIIPAGRLATKYDPLNIVFSCHACNYAEQRHRLKYRDKHREIFGPRYDALEIKSKEKVKFSVEDIKEMIYKINTAIERLGDER